MGYNLFDTATSHLDFQLGRHYMSDLFDSVIEFDSQFDGALLNYQYNTALKAKVGAFVIDYRTGHYGYAGRELNGYKLMIQN